LVGDTLEDGGGKFLKNVSEYALNYAVLIPRKECGKPSFSPVGYFLEKSHKW
jgi:hypothetical protein